jgi:hypothetical protein
MPLKAADSPHSNLSSYLSQRSTRTHRYIKIKLKLIIVISVLVLVQLVADERHKLGLSSKAARLAAPKLATRRSLVQIPTPLSEQIIYKQAKAN